MRILVLGDSNADYKTTFAKINALAKKQQFDCALCLGNLFSKDQDLTAVLDNEYELKITTYFVNGSLAIPRELVDHAALHAGQICENLFLLGSTGRIVLANGLRLAFCDTGRHGEVLEEPSAEADVLMAASSPIAGQTNVTDLTTRVVLKVRPKYLFSAGPTFEEHPPYRNTMPDGSHKVTREITLAPVANKMKSKWFYAFVLTSDPPTSELLKSLPENPYVLPKTNKKRSLSPNPETHPGKLLVVERNSKKPPAGYVCKLCSEPDDHYYKNCPQSSVSKKATNRGDARNSRVSTKVDPETCFFCLSNPNLARHLLISIGDAGSYLALPKGGMTQNHVLIIPIDHKPTMKALGDSREAVTTEIDKYILALENMYKKLETTAVVFEISRSTGVHLHLQVVPVPLDKLQELEDAFLAFAETEGISMIKAEPSVTQEDYFRVKFPDTDVVLTGDLTGKRKFDLQFGRRVIADVMGVPQRAHWKDCIRTDEQETADALAFKLSFKAFDPTLT